MKNLGGWRRLWVAVSGILFLLSSPFVVVSSQASEPYKMAGIVLTIWAAGCVLIYILGALAGWVYRGFKGAT